jgi:hypothetical protein
MTWRVVASRWWSFQRHFWSSSGAAWRSPGPSICMSVRYLKAKSKCGGKVFKSNCCLDVNNVALYSCLYYNTILFLTARTQAPYLGMTSITYFLCCSHFMCSFAIFLCRCLPKPESAQSKTKSNCTAWYHEFQQLATWITWGWCIRFRHLCKFRHIIYAKL